MTEQEAPLVVETQGGLSVSYRGRQLYSMREPAALPRRVAAACDRGPARLHLVPSPLLWHGVPELLASMGPGSALLCVEADPALADLARAHMPPELSSDPRLAFIECSRPEEAIEAALRLGSFRACVLCALSGGASLARDLYARMAALLGAELEASWRNGAALMVLGDRWARNILDNVAALPEIAPAPLPRLGGAAIVCGAGPSLEAVLPLVARHRDRLAVLACDTALGTLLGAGIEPDLVVCLEGQSHNLADFTPLGSRPTSLAADLSSHPATFRALRGPKHLSLVRITRSPFLDRLGAALAEAGIPAAAMPPLGSVGVHAVALARMAASGPLFAAGLDFSFERGKTHARGCPSLLAEELRLDRLTRWPGQYGASFRDRTMVLEGSGGPGGGRLSDPILLSYAAVLAQGRGREPLYDLRGGGPDIGGRPLGLAGAEELLAALPPRHAPARARGGDRDEGGPSPGRPDGRLRALARGLVLGELDRLTRLLGSMRGSRLLEREAFASLLHESDYLYWGFPDRDRAASLPQDFLNRLVPRMEHWASRLRGLAERLGG
jgi:hypothetical protein